VPILKREAFKANVIIRVLLPIWDFPRASICRAGRVKMLRGL
jgi:hypothetical protein